MDIALDTFPYHGTTTTCEAMWMGVPVVSLAGQRHVSRVGVSLLNNVGLPELVANTPEEYVRIAVDLANDLPRLQELRSTLRQRMEQSPLMDAPRFARNVEAAYRQMWRKWCATCRNSRSNKHSIWHCSTTKPGDCRRPSRFTGRFWPSSRIMPTHCIVGSDCPSGGAP